MQVLQEANEMLDKSIENHIQDYEYFGKSFPYESDTESQTEPTSGMPKMSPEEIKRIMSMINNMKARKANKNKRRIDPVKRKSKRKSQAKARRKNRSK